jgi:RNA polymerase sigma factor (sigma-70 family)
MAACPRMMSGVEGEVVVRSVDVASVLPEIRWVARQLYAAGAGSVRLEDLIQAGAEAVHVYRDRFDPSKGALHKWVQQHARRAMRLLIHSQASDVHISQEEWEGRVRLKRERAPSRPTVEQRDHRLLASRGDACSYPMHVLAEERDDTTPEALFATAQAKDRARLAVLELSDSQRELVCHMFGMHGRELLSMREYASRIGVSRTTLDREYKLARALLVRLLRGLE